MCGTDRCLFGSSEKEKKQWRAAAAAKAAAARHPGGARETTGRKNNKNRRGTTHHPRGGRQFRRSTSPPRSPLPQPAIAKGPKLALRRRSVEGEEAGERTAVLGANIPGTGHSPTEAAVGSGGSVLERLRRGPRGEVLGNPGPIGKPPTKPELFETPEPLLKKVKIEPKTTKGVLEVISRRADLRTRQIVWPTPKGPPISLAPP